jgi:KilA-N domain/Meiotically up-regulated gene 113
MTNIVTVDGFNFQYRDDEYINLTKMCKQSGKELKRFLALKDTKSFLNVLSNRLNTNISKLLKIKVGGIPTQQGTLGHPLIALHLAQWLSPEMYVDIALKLSHLVNKDFLNDFNLDETIKDTSGFIYLVHISESNFYKIGYTKNIIKRLSTLQTANALELVIIERFFSLNAKYLEMQIHKHYEFQRVRGEWFQFSKEQVKDFVSVINNLDKDGDNFIFDKPSGDKKCAGVCGNTAKAVKSFSDLTTGNIED